MENIDISVFAEEISIETDANQETPKKRKRSSSRYEETRLRCKKKLAYLANTFITILESLNERELFHLSTAKMDKEEGEKKGRKSLYWYGDDSFYTPWNIRINGEMNIRIFALAYLLRDCLKISAK